MSIVILMENGIVEKISKMSPHECPSTSLIMECEGETAECYTKFFSLINEEMGKVVAGRVFCPIAGFMTDEAGGLQEGPAKKSLWKFSS